MGSFDVPNEYPVTDTTAPVGAEDTSSLGQLEESTGFGFPQLPTQEGPVNPYVTRLMGIMNTQGGLGIGVNFIRDYVSRYANGDFTPGNVASGEFELDRGDALALFVFAQQLLDSNNEHISTNKSLQQLNSFVAENITLFSDGTGEALLINRTRFQAEDLVERAHYDQVGENALKAIQRYYDASGDAEGAANMVADYKGVLGNNGIENSHVELSAIFPNLATIIKKLGAEIGNLLKVLEDEQDPDVVRKVSSLVNSVTNFVALGTEDSLESQIQEIAKLGGNYFGIASQLKSKLREKVATLKVAEETNFTFSALPDAGRPAISKSA